MSNLISTAIFSLYNSTLVELTLQSTILFIAIYLTAVLSNDVTLKFVLGNEHLHVENIL